MVAVVLAHLQGQRQRVPTAVLAVLAHLMITKLAVAKPTAVAVVAVAVAVTRFPLVALAVLAVVVLVAVVVTSRFPHQARLVRQAVQEQPILAVVAVAVVAVSHLLAWALAQVPLGVLALSLLGSLTHNLQRCNYG